MTHSRKTTRRNSALLIGGLLMSGLGNAPADEAIQSGEEEQPHILSDLHLRDPFILPVKSESRYYLFGSVFDLPDGPGFKVYWSTDLTRWHGPQVAFRRPEGFGAARDFWAPEVWQHHERYFMFASFLHPGRRRGTQILVADRPGGPYRPHSDGPVTPAEWDCLDGTLFVDEEGKRWMVFCHEWTQVHDGEICAMLLTPDLRAAAGEPLLLFRASDAPWTVEIGREPRRGRVTDGPFLYRLSSGALAMLWSSFCRSGYALAVAYSPRGKLAGPWEHPPEPLFAEDGGHGMLFRTFEGDLRIVFHSPNAGPHERPRLLRVREQDGHLMIAAPGATMR